MNVLFWLTTAWRYLWRSRSSTGTLGAMIFCAVSTLIFLDALAVGVNDAMIRNSVSLVAGHISADHLPATLTPKALRIEGVRQVLRRQNEHVWLTASGHMAPVQLMAVEPEKEKAVTALWRKTIQGTYLSQDGDGIFLGEPAARDLGLNIGDKVMVGSEPGRMTHTYTLVGIYRTGITQLDRNLAFCSLRQSAGSWSAAIFLKDGVSPESIATSYRHLATSGQFATWAERMPDLKQLIDLNSLCMLLVMILVFFVVSLGIACAFVIFILRNIREHGILKAMGVRSQETALLLFLEIILLTLSSAAAGILAGSALTLLVAQFGVDLGALTSHNQYFAVSGIIFPRLTWTGLAIPPALALLFALLAGIWPTWMVVRKRPAEILRSI